MKAFFLLLLIAAFAAQRSLSENDTKPKSDAQMTQQYANHYKALPYGIKRVHCCVDWIDQGLFKRGVSFNYVKEIFAGELDITRGEGGKECEARVWFSKQIEHKSELEQVPLIGWYFQVQFGKTGLIENYSLSNIHK